VFEAGQDTDNFVTGDAGSLLRSWLTEADPAQSRQLFEDLFCRFIDPWLGQLTASALRRAGQRDSDRIEQTEEIQAEVRLQLTAHLTRLREPGQPPVRDLRAYTASMVYNATFLRLRARSPRRCQLQNKLHYVLRNDPRFAIWAGPGGQIAGLARWAGSANTAPTPIVGFAPADPAAFLEKVFDQAGGPVAFSRLVGLAVELWGGDDPHAPIDDNVHPSAQPPHEDTLQQREQLRSLWMELKTLPPLQRAALLLNLRDESGQGVIELIPATGLATFGELADSMNMSAKELAEVWHDLPLDDATIGGRLGLTRQQVINLRKSGRARLVRRVQPGNTSRLQAAPGNTSGDSSSTAAGPVTTTGRSLRTATQAVRRLFQGRRAE